MPLPTIETDYLVIGAGLNGLSFADELLTRSDAHITLVDRRDSPGGHWNDAYPFVKLHQPSEFYGVESRELSNGRVDARGLNKGLFSLAGGPEITAYCHALMSERLLPSGRVTYLPSTACEADGSLRGVLSGESTAVQVRRKWVDATYYDSSIPLTHEREFEVHPSVTCGPPNDLPRQAEAFGHYAVLGGGKTGMDSCLWLLAQGVAPERIRWVVPRDLWFVDRAKLQPTSERFAEVFGSFADLYENLAAASSADDFGLRTERSGRWLRLSPAVQPQVNHSANISRMELAELRRIRDVVRLGRVRSLAPGEIVLEGGVLSAAPDTFYVDCTASAVSRKPPVPVFQGKRILLQILRYPLIPLSAALIAFLETRFDGDEEKNRFASPIPFADSMNDYVRALKIDLDNRLAAAGDPQVKAWFEQSRLDPFSGLAADVSPDETDKLAILTRLKAALQAANANLPHLIASMDEAGTSGAVQARDGRARTPVPVA